MPDPTRDYVLRALAASEIADGCLRADLRARFTDLAEGWLARAAEAAGVDPPADRPDATATA
ncbi:MAG: hypothetical protein ACOY5Y_17645 [Pseudomonadota bacterium]